MRAAPAAEIEVLLGLLGMHFQVQNEARQEFTDSFAENRENINTKDMCTYHEEWKNNPFYRWELIK
jgi:hypothetical protein